VWFVGHCIVSPINAKDKSMALVGSVVTKDMDENKIYAGSPAKDITEKVLPQFKKITIEEKWKIVKSLEIPKIFAIGGVVFKDIELLQQIGIYGVAVSGQITNQPSITKEFKTVLQ
jgi:thiamine monophosphate synthase